MPIEMRRETQITPYSRGISSIYSEVIRSWGFWLLEANEDGCCEHIMVNCLVG